VPYLGTAHHLFPNMGCTDLFSRKVDKSQCHMAQSSISMSNVSDLYTLWLKPWHLPPGKPWVVTIQKAEVRTIHPRPTEEKKALILSFVGKNRKLILNDGNANKLADIGGEDTEGWAGLVIQLKRTSYTKDKETIVISPAPTNGNGK
jgi:hypothetical protein